MGRKESNQTNKQTKYLHFIGTFNWIAMVTRVADQKLFELSFIQEALY